MRNRFLVGSALLLLFACNPGSEQPGNELNIPFEKYELENGLDVVLHLDRSDPVVAVVLAVHVGSAREREGRTGFAHLFEHLLFNESENLGKGGLDALSARVGGSGANGSTSRDRTNYFQTVPGDALEKMIWAEADKLGWFINTVTEPVLEKEKQVVKNEKRQGVDNRPYGHTSYVISRNLYPPEHPYSWTVIGEMDDIQNSQLSDVRSFYNRWYVPGNATLVLAGDFEVEQAKQWVEKYFGEIAAGEEIMPFDTQPVTLDRTVRLFHEDNFARLPELNLTWPGVARFHPDSYPLDVLAQYLSQGKQSPLNKVVAEQEKLASQVRVNAGASEISGQVSLTVRAFEGTDLDSVMEALREGFQRFESEGISEVDLEGIKAMQEYGFYSGLSSVMGKGIQLAEYNILAGDPGFLAVDLQRMREVKAEDVMRVYGVYIRDQYHVATSFVPKGQRELMLEGSQRASVVEEEVDPEVEYVFDATAEAVYERTPSRIDRSLEPPYGDATGITVPVIWEEQLANGLKIYGIESDEVPLVHFNLTILGGQLTDHPDQGGVVNLTTRMMTRGTSGKTAEELEEAIQQLGATIRVTAGKESIRLSGSTLARNYEATIMLLEEILLEPRWDPEEFDLLKKSTISQIQQQKADPLAIAENVYNALIFGDASLKSRNILGTESSVETIQIEDLKAYFQTYISPGSAAFFVEGNVDRERVAGSLKNLEERWEGSTARFPAGSTPLPPDRSTVYFFDVPGAKQSIFRIGRPALAATDEDYYPAQVMNYKLGGGGFASVLTQELRQNKGYTYGIRSGFSGTNEAGPFTVSTSVQSKVTLDAALLIRQIMEAYPAAFSEADLQMTKSFLTRSNARAFESDNAKLQMLENIHLYGWDHDYVRQREAIVREMTLERIRQLAESYADPGRMIWLVVGDGETQLEQLKQLGYGDPVEITE